MVGLIDWSLLPVQLFHNFCHFSDISFVARGSSSEAGDFNAVTVRERPSFAAESAFSFPGMPTWLGIQHKAMVFPCFVWTEYSLTNFSTRSLSLPEWEAEFYYRPTGDDLFVLYLLSCTVLVLHLQKVDHRGNAFVHCTSLLCLTHYWWNSSMMIA